MDKMYVLDMLSDILALILGEDTEGAKAICRNEMKKNRNRHIPRRLIYF